MDKLRMAMNRTEMDMQSKGRKSWAMDVRGDEEKRNGRAWL